MNYTYSDIHINPHSSSHTCCVFAGQATGRGHSALPSEHPHPPGPAGHTGQREEFPGERGGSLEVEDEPPHRAVPQSRPRGTQESHVRL